MGAARFVALIIILLATSYSRIFEDLHPDDAAAWGQSGNYIVNYGTTLNPYDPISKNSYSVHDPMGRELDMVSGGPGYFPNSIPTHGGSYVFFSGKYVQVGERQGIVNLEGGENTLLFGASKSGGWGVAVVNAVGDSDVKSRIQVLNGDGDVHSVDLNMCPHSLAVGNDLALLVGEGDDIRYLVAVDKFGRWGEVDFPKGYNIKSRDFPYSHVSYVGGGKFQILEADGVENRFTSYTVELPEIGSKFIVIGSPYQFSRIIDDSALAVQNFGMPGGIIGYVDRGGNVFLEGPFGSMVRAGNIGQFEAGDFIPVFSSSGEPLFGIMKDKTVRIRRWSAPEEVISEISISGHPCRDSGCRISGISRIP